MERAMKFKLVWKALFKDGSKLNQFEDIEQTQENKFEKVLEKQDELIRFRLTNILTNKIYEVDLVSGTISTFFNSPANIEIDQYRGEQKYRLIYFRRVVRELSINQNTLNDNIKQITFFLGFQYTENERNHKRIMQIFDDDREVIY
jgi:hypothetical protein